MIRVDKIWLAVEPMDMRAGPDTALARVIRDFGQAVPHHAYMFANKRANRMKILVHDGSGVWLAARRLNEGGYPTIQCRLAFYFYLINFNTIINSTLGSSLLLCFSLFFINYFFNSKFKTLSNRSSISFELSIADRISPTCDSSPCASAFLSRLKMRKPSFSCLFSKPYPSLSI